MTGRRKAQQRPTGLIVPISALEPRRIVGSCYVCGDAVYAGDEAHIGNCAREALAEIQAEREAEKKRLAVFQEENWDPEVAEHMKKVGERMVREGRMEVKPSERAGFS